MKHAQFIALARVVVAGCRTCDGVGTVTDHVKRGRVHAISAAPCPSCGMLREMLQTAERKVIDKVERQPFGDF